MNTTKTPHTKRTPEERAEHRRQYLKLYMRRYRKENADKTLAWRVQAAKNLLQREGYDVEPQEEDDDDFEIVITNPGRIFEGFAEGGDDEA